MAPVLIVDDDAATLESLSEALQIAGFAVQAASRGEEAIHVAVRERPAAIVVDYRMPGMSGVEVIARLHSMPGLRDLCAILATAWDALPGDLDAATFVLEKPFTMDRLLALLDRCGVSASPAAAAP